MIRFPFPKPRPRDLDAAQTAAEREGGPDEIAAAEPSPGEPIQEENRAETAAAPLDLYPARDGADQVATSIETAPDHSETGQKGTGEEEFHGEETGAEETGGEDADLREPGLEEPVLELGAGAIRAPGEDGVNIPMEEQVRMVEAMLFASERPLSTAELASRMPIGCDAAVAVRRLEEMYETRGVRLARVAGKWVFRTAPDLAHLLTGESVETRKLSRAAIETLAIVAYHQPVTRAEIEDIRGVGVSKGTVDLLMELEWIKLGRRRQTPGRPVTFVTTEKFLEHFGLESLKDLPRLDELRQAGLLESRPPIGAPIAGASSEADDSDDEDDDDAQDPQDRQDLLM